MQPQRQTRYQRFPVVVLALASLALPNSLFAQGNRNQETGSPQKPLQVGSSAPNSAQPFSAQYNAPPTQTAPVQTAHNDPANINPHGFRSTNRITLASANEGAQQQGAQQQGASPLRTSEDAWIKDRNHTSQATPPNQAPFRQPQVVQAASWTESLSNTESSKSVSESSRLQANQSVASESGSAQKKLALRPPSSKSSGEIEAPRNSWTSLVSMFASLAVVIGLFLGAAWMFRRTASPTSANLPKEVVQVLGRCAMAPRQQLYLLRFGNRLVLVTHQLGQTETISEIDDPLEVDRIAGICEQHSNGSVSQSFRNVLQQVSMGQGTPSKRGSLVR